MTFRHPSGRSLESSDTDFANSWTASGNRSWLRILCSALDLCCLYEAQRKFPCPTNSHYELCGTSCPAACPSLSFPYLCTQHCQEGCQCDDGLLLSGDHCVPPIGC
uniref:TIL domain-containing protein n=1 Tax=Astyanax mexicanus TaxID=7994 RepID=A0A3B1JMS9_ASTMX